MKFLGKFFFQKDHEFEKFQIVKSNFFTFFSKTSRAILPTELYQLVRYTPWKKCEHQNRVVQAEKAAAIK